MDWTKASGDTVVCESCDLNLRDVVRAVALNDADTVEMVGSITGKDVETCRETIQEILDIYVPVYSALKNGCGGGCSGCSGCN